MTMLKGSVRARAPWIALVASLPLILTAACGGGGSGGETAETSPEPVDASAGTIDTVDQACVPAALELAASASLSGMPGTYHLVLMALGPSPSSSQGSLTLETLPEALQEMAGARTPLGGSTDIDVEAVGALRLGDLGSDDPEAPGVLVIESDGPSIVLRLGSEPNRRDRVAFDGGFTVLAVRQIQEDGFDGSWRSGSGGVTTEGYFCARRSED